MRVLLVVEGFNSLSGVAEAIDNLAAEAVSAGHEVAVVSTYDRDAARSGAERIARGDVKPTYLTIRGRKPPSWRHLERIIREPVTARCTQLAGFVRSWQPDVVNSHVSSWDAYPTMVAACRVSGVPSVQSFWDTGPRGRGKLGDQALLALRHARAFTTGSAATRDFFSHHLGAVAAAPVIIGGVDLAAAGAAQVLPRRRFIFCAARLDLRFKAIDTLVSAFSLLDDHQTDLLIAGGGPDRETIERQIARCRLTDRVRLLGVLPRHELRRFYRGAALFAMPSRCEEGVPLVFLEALAAGTPVVGTATGGTHELIEHGKTGLLVAEDAPQELAQAMAELLRNSDMAERLGRLGRERVAAEYVWPKFAAKYFEVYRSCLNSF